MDDFAAFYLFKIYIKSYLHVSWSNCYKFILENS